MEPFKRDEIELHVKACDFCEEGETDRRRKFIMQRSTAKRDKAILLTMLDTGLRTGKLCIFRVGEVDLKTGKIRIRPGEAGKAMGGKGRIIYMGKSSRRFLWRYRAEREDGEDPDAQLFLGSFSRSSIISNLFICGDIIIV